VNGKTVNIPSYQVAEGDEISIAEKSQSQKRITQALSLSEQREECEWVSVDKSKFTGTFKNLPTRELLSSEINENYIVELYSR
jgi:small subunit ribosomal protein S4